MSKKTYNIYFHLHTVSGIVITVGLFVIFFAGAFTLFFKEIEDWERNRDKVTVSSNTITNKKFDLDKLIYQLNQKEYDLYGRNIYIDLGTAGVEQPVYLSESEDTLAKGEAKEYKNLIVNKETFQIQEVPKNASASMGALLYDLHYFYQLGDFGYYLSGLVALFFLFAIISGIIVHWKKIISNFYLFRPYEKLKTVWTDAHTALGVIGLPFQFMYALTGAWFGLGILVATTGALLYDNDKEKYYDEVYGHHDDSLGKKIDAQDFRLNSMLDSATAKWPGFELTYISLHKVGSQNMKMHAYGEVSTKSSFFNFGEVEFDVASGKIIHAEGPYNKSYEEIVSAFIHRVHFGYFGLKGWPHLVVKALYFLLAITTCFVIITGVLIWLEARNKNNLEAKKKKFNQNVGYIYLSICLSMLPITALSFMLSKVLPESFSSNRHILLNAVFFGGWLLLSILLFFLKNNYRINKITLLYGGLLGLIIPIINGFVSGNWLWLTINTHVNIFVTDLLWLLLSLAALYVYVKIKKPVIE